MIAPALGGRITELEAAGRQWLWHDPSAAFRRPEYDGASDDLTFARHDGGGWSECFPTSAACELPASVVRYAGVRLPDHGELWSQPVEVIVDTTDDGPRATCEWLGRRLPYGLTRSVTVQGDGSVVARWSAVNASTVKLPFVWMARPRFPMNAETRLELPDQARARVTDHHRLQVVGNGADHRWPRLRAGQGWTDVSHPAVVARRYSCRFFVECPVGSAAIVEPDARLTMTWDAARLPYVGVSLERGARSIVSLDPSSGAPDSLRDAIADWHAAQSLAPGEHREWSVSWRAERRSTGDES